MSLRGITTAAVSCAIATLLAGCPINPTINVAGLTCTEPGDDCGNGFQCVNGTCEQQLGQGTGGTTSGGTSGGGTGSTACTFPDGSFLRNPGDAGVLGQCTADGDCPCQTNCVRDRAYQLVYESPMACEQPCLVTSDCVSDIATVCTDAGYCALNLCGVVLDGGAPNGALFGSCSSGGPGTGTCEPRGSLPGGGPPYGFCEWGGDAGLGGTCGGASRIGAIDCAVGLICSGQAQGGGLYCQRLCNPDGGSVCDAGQSCQELGQSVIYTCQ